MLLWRVAAASVLRARVTQSRRALSAAAALSTSTHAAQVEQATNPPSSLGNSPTQQQRIGQESSLQADLETARHLMREKFNIHSISPEQETVLERVLAGQDVLLDMAPGRTRHAFQVIPGLVQGGLTIIIVTSIINGVNYAGYLKKMGIRAFYLDLMTLQSLGDDQVLECSELDVLLFNSSYSYTKMARLLADAKHRVALLTIDEADRSSKLSAKYSDRYASWSSLRHELLPRSVLCTTHLPRPNANIVQQTQQIYQLPASSHIIVHDKAGNNLLIDAIPLRRNHDKFATVRSLLDRHTGTTVIVTASDAVAADIGLKLRQDGYDAKAIAFKRSERTGSFDPELFNADNPILCITKSMAKHLNHANIRHIIWHCLATSPVQFLGVNQLAGRDGASSRCTVLLSEQEIFNVHSSILASTPSLQHIRTIIANIFAGREELKAGASFWVETSRLRLLSDLNIDDWKKITDILRDEGILHVPQSWTSNIANGPRLESAYGKVSHPLAVDMIRVVEEVTGSRMEEPFYFFEERLGALAASGLFQRDPENSHLRTFYKIMLDKDANFSQSEINRIAEKILAEFRLRESARMRARHQYIDIFTEKRCLLIPLAESMGQQLTPSQRKPCGRCLFCVTHKSVALTPLSQIERPINTARLDAIIHSVPPEYANDPRFLARVGLGVLSYRLKAYDLDQNRYIFGSMRLNRFEGLLRAFAKRIGVPASKMHEC